MGAMATGDAEMRTDAYTECRGVGRIGANPRVLVGIRQAGNSQLHNTTIAQKQSNGEDREQSC
ncbi:hypothetical protein D3C78_1578030 [compost metagenome]